MSDTKQVAQAITKGATEGSFSARTGLPEYTSWMDECRSWWDNCYIGDWTFLTKLRFKGPDALKFLSTLSVNSFAKYDIGQAKHVSQCNKDGALIHEGILIRLDEDDFVYCSGPFIYYDLYMFQKSNYQATVEEVKWFNFQLQGPNALALTEKLAGESMRDVKFMHVKKIKIKGHEIYALRQGMAGELGFELMGPEELYDEIYNEILAVGQDFDIRRLGARAFPVNHLENCFPTLCIDYLPAIFSEDQKELLEFMKQKAPFAFAMLLKTTGSVKSDDIRTWYRNPAELGWGKNIKFDHEFVGSEALSKILAEDKRRIVTLEWNAEDVIDVFASMFSDGDMYHYMEFPRNGPPFMYTDMVLNKEGKDIGATTSRGYSVNFRKMISLCTIDTEYSTPGTEVTVIWGNHGEPQKLIRATVAPAPYKKNHNKEMDLAKLSK